jgi:hypothetical protein
VMKRQQETNFFLNVLVKLAQSMKKAMQKKVMSLKYNTVDRYS